MPPLLLRHATVFAGERHWPLLADHMVFADLGRILAVLPEGGAHSLKLPPNALEVDCAGALLTPGLIDCHTHLLFGGARAKEFAMRLAGRPYQEIAAAGGGIASTVRATRAASDEGLLAAAMARLGEMARQGVTTVEVKSGYGLDTEHELRLLRLARELGRRAPQEIVPTFLGAHAVGPEFSGDRAAYLRCVREEMLPAVAREKLATSVDAFCETGAFTAEEVSELFGEARALGLRVRIHAEQFGWHGGAAMAARHGALSADHLEYLKPEEAPLLAASGTVAVLLPGAQLTLALPNPPVAALREAGAAIALATDCNPGTSMTTNLHLMLQLGAALYRLSPEECLAAATANAARALGIRERTGTIAPGQAADLLLWDAATPAEALYRLGAAPVRRVWKGGREITP